MLFIMGLALQRQNRRRLGATTVLVANIFDELTHG